jgi:hypothetical protein
MTKILYWLDKLSSRPKIGGLQISDSALQFVLIEKDQPRTAALRLPPGIIKVGRIQNRAALAELLRQLHQIIEPDKDSKKIRAIVSLSSELVYSQSFNVPNVDPSLINESARLNLQIVSPLSPERVYASWQIVDENPDRYEFLGALAERSVVDEFIAVLSEANFTPITFEFPALALTRLVSHAVAPAPQAVLTLNISSDGLDLFILKNGKLYFDHFRSWLSIQGESRQITKRAFESAVIEEVQQVINFTINRFKERLRQAIIIAPGFESEIGGLLGERFGLAVAPLAVRDFVSLGPSWFIALGSALRGLADRSRDQDISLSPFSSIESYYQEQTFHFAVLWRNIIIEVAVVFLIVFIGVNVFLVDVFNQNQTQLESFKTRPVIQELTVLQEKVQEFNRLVVMAEQAKTAAPSWLPFLEQLQTLADRHRVHYDRIIMSSIREPIHINARAPSSAVAVAFKNTFTQQPNFKNVDLPLVSATVLDDGSVGFALSFSLR